MYRVDRNDFYKEQKNSTVYTPPELSQFLFSIVHKKIKSDRIVFDPCVGKGSLLIPFKQAGFKTKGVDIEDQGFPDTIVRDFISLSRGEVEKPALVIANPPFNIEEKTKQLVSETFGRRPLLLEVWLRKTIELFGKNIPIVLFAPYGLRLNQTLNSKRWMRFVDGTYPEITSIVALPKDIYNDVLFHSEVLIFNIHGLKGALFLQWLEQRICAKTRRNTRSRIKTPNGATKPSIIKGAGQRHEFDLVFTD